MNNPVPNKPASSLILIQTAVRLSNASTLEDITSIVTETARTLVDSDGSTFVLKEQDLCYYVDENAISSLWKGKKFPMSACISGWSMINKKSVTILDIYRDERIPHDAYRPTFVKSLCMVPIRKDSPIGAIGNYWKNITKIEPEQIELLQIIADIASNAIENLNLRSSLKDKVVQNEALTGKNKDLETYIHSMAHDLKSPLSSLNGLVDLLQLSIDNNNPEKTRSYLATLKECSKNINLQIEKILGLYRASNEQLQPKVIDFKKLTKEIIDNLLIQYPGKQVSIEIESNLFAIGDPILLRIALENLIGNSFKFSQENLGLKIKIGKSDTEGSYSTFYLKDNGIGINTSDVSKLFKPLSRLHDEKRYPGMGLGLYSVSQIIKLHGGDVRAEGKFKEGATFYFSLPTRMKS